MADDVLLREGQCSFGTPNASHHHMLSLAGYLQSNTYRGCAQPVYVVHGTRPRLRDSDLVPCLIENTLAIIPFTLPGVRYQLALDGEASRAATCLTHIA
jgi:hypothetical protein